jgi:hypothetical protein
MARYEVWKKENLGQRKATPEDTFFTLDNAISAAKKLSIGTHKVSSWDPDPKDPWGFGKPTEIDVANMYALVERSNSQSVIRGYGINGVWKDAVAHCKRCNDSGQDKQHWQESCPSCKGASYKPRV